MSGDLWAKQIMFSRRWKKETSQIADRERKESDRQTDRGG